MRLILYVLALVGSVSAINSQQVADGVARLPAFIQATLNATKIPGLAIVVVFNDTVQFSAGYGVRQAGSDLMVSPKTVFQIASLSKPISSTIVAGIIDDGANVTWDSRANNLNHVVQYPDPWITQEVTLADLFSMRSGLYGLAGDDLDQFGFNRSTILPRLQYMKPGGTFRASYGYSNYGITLGAVSAAQSTGKEWEDIADDILFGPLNMSMTSYRHSDFISRLDRADLHVLTNGTFTVAPPRNPDAQGPAAGVSLNVEDLSKWLRMHLASGKFEGEQIINTAPLNATRLPHNQRGADIITGLPSAYGYGWNVGQDGNLVYASHAGAFSQGTRSFAYISVEEGLGIGVLSNCFPTGVPEGITYTLLDYIRYGHSTRDWITIWDGLYDELAASVDGSSSGFSQVQVSPTPPLENNAYAGVYSNDYAGEVEVITSEVGLEIKIGPKENATFLPLKHWNRDVFVLIPFTDPNEITGVTFLVGPGGNSTGVIIDALNSNGGGVLTRLPGTTCNS